MRKDFPFEYCCQHDFFTLEHLEDYLREHVPVLPTNIKNKYCELCSLRVISEELTGNLAGNLQHNVRTSTVDPSSSTEKPSNASRAKEFNENFNLEGLVIF